MSKRNKIIYWIATLWLALGMLSTGIVQLIKMDKEVDMMKHLGYPIYFLSIIGVWKILGVVAILIPGYPRIKEWAYAGLLFDLGGATYSIIASGQSVGNWIFMVLPIGLGICSYIYYHKKSKTNLVASNSQLADQTNYYQNGKIKIAV